MLGRKRGDIVHAVGQISALSHPAVSTAAAAAAVPAAMLARVQLRPKKEMLPSLLLDIIFSLQRSIGPWQ